MSGRWRLPEPWPGRLTPDALRRLLFGLLVGGAGGAVGAAVGLPLAWMLGSMFGCMAAALAGLPVMVPIWFRAWAMVVVGLFLGQAFDGLTPARLAEWPLSVGAAMLYVPVAAAAAFVFYRRAARQPPITAACSAMPGGVTAMVLIAAELGADDRRVAMAQVFRIAIVVCAAPFVAFWVLGLPQDPPGGIAERPGIAGADFLLLGAAAIAGMLALGRLGVPIPWLLGPLLASALLRMGGLAEGALPAWLVEVALVVTGSSIGTRFAGVPLGAWARFAVLTLGGTLILLAVSAGFAFAVAASSDVELFAALLAFAPGGVAEMSLIALAIGADPGYVAVMHVVRIGFILAMMPLVGAVLRRLSERSADRKHADEEAGTDGSDASST